MANLVAIGILWSAAIIVNSLVCLLVYKYKMMRTYTNGFVVSLAVSDILTGLVILAQYLIGLDNRIVVNIAYAVVMLSGVANLCAVTYDRYIAVTQPLRYLTIMQKNCRTLVVGVWLVSIVVAVLPLLWQGQPRNASIHKIFVMAVQIMFIGLPFILIVASHCMIYYHAKKCSKLSRQLSTIHVISSKRNSLRRTASEFKVARVFALVSVLFLLSWFPVFFYTTAALFNRAYLVPRKLIELSPITLALGSLGNPLIYSLIKPDFRKALRRLFGTQDSRSGESSASTDPTSFTRMSQKPSLVSGYQQPTLKETDL